jgi:hypothetical protein
MKTPTDDCFVSIHGGFGQAPTIVARTALPADAPMLCDRRKMSVALRCRGLVRNGRRPGRDDDGGLGMTFSHSSVNGFAVIRAVCRQRRNVSLDLFEQLREFGNVADIIRRQFHGDDFMRVGINAQMQLAPAAA